MALRQLSSVDPTPDFRRGYVLYETAPQPGLPTVYHTMLVRSAKLRTPKDARVQVQVADMTLDGIRFGQEWDPKWRVSNSCHLGSLEEPGAAEHARVLEVLETLRPRPSVRDEPVGVYSLSGHAVFKLDPANPRREIFHCSCASLIEWCFEEALGVDLVAEESLPMYDAARVREAFCPEMEMTAVKRQLAAWGLDPEGSWPLLLPAQQMRAFRMAPAELPRAALYDDHPIT